MDNAPTPTFENSVINKHVPPSIPLTEVSITDDNVALNVLVSFLNLAQKRGAYSMDESAKVWECVQRFIQK
jgi:hypothetical protein